MPNKEVLEETNRLLEHYETLLHKRDLFPEQQVALLLQRALDLKDDESATRAYLLLSTFQLECALNHLQALDLAKRALEQSEHLPENYWRLKALNTIAACYYTLRDYPNELKVLQQALQLLEADDCNEPKYYPLHYITNHSMGVVFSQMGLHSLALPYIEAALRYSQSTDDRFTLFKAKMLLANLQYYKGEHSAAYAGYTELLETYSEFNETDHWASLTTHLGELCKVLGQLDAAEKHLRDSVRVREKLGDDLPLNYSYYNLARLLYETNRAEEADKYFVIIQNVIEKYPYHFDAQMRNYFFYELYASKADYKKAYEYFRKLDASAFSNEMIEKTVSSIFENEHAKQKSMMEDTEYFRKLNAEMKSHAGRLELLNKDLKNYAHTTSHDLREPLRMVSTYMSILETKLGAKLTDEEKQFLRFAVDGSRRMDEMITRILNNAKGNQSTIKPVDLNKVAEQLKMNLTKLIAEKNAAVTFHKLPVLMVDDIQMLQVFQNLVTNAIKYNSNPQPTIQISAETKDGFVQLSVADNGVGIPEAAREKVFEMFSRVENESGADGTGIGLSTVKNIIEKMKGKIWVEANEPQGSIFKILLPAG